MEIVTRKSVVDAFQVLHIAYHIFIVKLDPCLTYKVMHLVNFLLIFWSEAQNAIGIHHTVKCPYFLHNILPSFDIGEVPIPNPIYLTIQLLLLGLVCAFQSLQFIEDTLLLVIVKCRSN